ncbi:phosphoglucosamine mutase [Keratinibaculum paraultunense]|uniref:Phosphoglucosamine mutase n=1 Tax=Keratinibaculum paraultunense TaxID=1278232 RepID=A0A4R3KQR1_9FIRM|nr:phosphoglucosamine mutase [Keratinibaculum paraultunense]QQY79334.1 phosphoglucosamine mutase [Keratinibaculum paraultunense]TCS86647.1 phosphoglucosamine mutase [Keratinibaculum paraultunense]
MGKLFGTDGIRGIANKDLTPELAFKVGRAGAYVLSKGRKGQIVVGKDTRKSGDMLEGALTAGICSIGIDVISLGIVPTPAVAYLTRKYDGLAGVVISASHNPVEYNGIKFFNEKGYKLNDEIEEEIESIILENKDISLRPIKGDIGKIIFKHDGYRYYIEHLKSTVDGDLKGIKIAIDCGNGALYKIAPQLLKEMGGEIVVINDEPNGVNINVNCGSTNPDMIQSLVQKVDAHIGLSFDGDGDRVIAVDEKGNIIDGDHILAICGTYLYKRNKLNKNTIVGTVMTNMGLDVYLKEAGMNIVKTAVGDRYVIEEMLSNGYNLGGEQSGHIIFLDYNTTGDGLLTGLQLIQVMKESKKSMSQLNNIMTQFPQVLINAKVDNDKKEIILEDEFIKEEIKKIEDMFQGEGRVVIRPSGTEPLIRIMIEGKDKEKIENIANGLAKLIEEQIGK